MLNCNDHTDCIADALEKADLLCQQAGARLTRTRRRILALVWQSHQPRKAYDILTQLAGEDQKESRPPSKPPTVYRALDFLQEMGLVHKVDSLNAYIGCSGQQAHQYLVCQSCGDVADLHDRALAETLARKAGEAGFRVSTPVIEIKGQCERCVS